MMTSNIIKHHLDGLILHLDKYMPLASCNLVDYFTKSLYETTLNNAIQKDLINLDYKTVIDAIFNENAENDTKLGQFIYNCKNYSLYNLPEVCMDITAIHYKLQELGCDDIFGLKLNVFVKPKKSHEIEILSGITSAVHKICKTTHLVDIGDGKGYLSSILALHHKIKVLGIDSSIINTTSAVKRIQKLQKIWHGITTKDSKRSVLTKQEENFSSNALLYKQVTQYVNNGVDLSRLVSDVFMEPCSDIGIVGLHTCGDLGSTSLELFRKNPHVKSICNISCCYHLLSENDGKSNGFPMSNYLKSKNFKLGRTARMLSAQSIDRIIFNKQIPRNSIFYRAILQVIFQKYCKDMPVEHIGKVKKFDTFLDYYHAAAKNINLQLDINEKELQQLFMLHEAKHEEMNTFTLLRCLLAPVIESLILLDRLLYLQEQGITNAYLVKLFDPVISPRCYGIIAIKN